MKTESLTYGKDVAFCLLIEATPKPKAGDLMTVRGIRCRITKIHPLGTLDVVSLCGNYAFRVSGLPF